MRALISIGAAVFALAATAGDLHAIPAWARKYNMNCSGCHYPVMPRLNGDGLAFKWAGFRRPEEIGESVEVKKIEDYLAARGIVQYAYTKTQGSKADQNGFSIPAASLFVAGPVGKNFGGFFEFERTSDGAVDLIGQIAAVWGKENKFGGVRFVQGHLLVGGAVAGFDRPIGVLTPLPLSDPTAASPFTFAGDQAGLEASFVVDKRNRTSVGVVNGVMGGGMEGGGVSTKKDVFVTNQFIWDEDGGGLTTVGYYGTIAGLDSTLPDVNSHYYRLAATANHYFGPIEGLAGYVYSKDNDLPVGTIFGTSSITGSSYWLSGAYIMPNTHFTVYGRYEFLNPDRDATGAGTQRWVLGGVLPVNVPEYLRLGLEYFHDSPRLSSLPTRHGVFAQVHLAF